MIEDEQSLIEETLIDRSTQGPSAARTARGPVDTTHSSPFFASVSEQELLGAL